LATISKPAKRPKKRPLTARDLMRAAASLLPEDAGTDEGLSPQGVLAQLDIRVLDYLLDCLVELGHANSVPPSYWELLRRAAWLLPDVPAGAYHRRHVLPRPEGVRRELSPGSSAQALLLARRRSEGS
jgi:hypothetical protein